MRAYTFQDYRADVLRCMAVKPCKVPARPDGASRVAAVLLLCVALFLSLFMGLMWLEATQEPVRAVRVMNASGEVVTVLIPGEK